ncbi:MAG: hypothetical protein U9Q96_02610 [Patescibacteria group bacterium]|nr:hypothetical protein [Patescibacteria group bacterium]
MTKKIKFVIIGLILAFTLLLFGDQVMAQCTRAADCPDGIPVAACCPGGASNPESGILPCGSICCPCTLCFFFVLIERILEFIFFNLAPPLALLMLIIGGGMFMLATGEPQKVMQARKIITSVLIGIAVIYGSFFFIGLFLQAIGLAAWTETIYIDWWEQGIFNIDCPVP